MEVRRDDLRIAHSKRNASAALGRAEKTKHLSFAWFGASGGAPTPSAQLSVSPWSKPRKTDQLQT
jgi:hypothetical protein